MNSTAQPRPAKTGAISLTPHYHHVRAVTADLCRTLSPEDMTVQSMPDVSPSKWHLAHTTWFFERFLLSERLPEYRMFHPDFDFLLQLGVELAPEARRPRTDPETLETNVPGLHLAGVLIGGERTGEIFIENGRFHGKKIVAALTGARVAGTEPNAAPGE